MKNINGKIIFFMLKYYYQNKKAGKYFTCFKNVFVD